MTRITHAQLPTFLAFGNASIAICEVNELAHRHPISDMAGDLLAEIRSAHVQLRELFDQGLDDAVLVLAQDVMEMISAVAEVLNKDQ
jgi:hypothetical protein